MYLYESHLGGIYATAEEQDWEELYCEECGDSDTLIGYFDDNNPEEAWKALIPYDFECIGCQKPEEMCNTCNEEYRTNYCYSLQYVMDILIGNFNCPGKSVIYLMIHNTHNDSYYLGCNFNKNRKTGEVTTVTHVPIHSNCFKDSLAEKVAISLVPYAELEISRRVLPKLVEARKEKNGTKSIVYMIEADFGDTDTETVSYSEWSWTGWIPAKLVQFEERFASPAIYNLIDSHRRKMVKLKDKETS